MFKKLFPDVYRTMDVQICAVNDDITRAARVRTSSVAERIATVLEFSLPSNVSARNKTCALRRIGEVIYFSDGDHAPLFENQENFAKLTAQIAEATLDNEGYMELAIGLAKLKLHPQSRLVNVCYVKLQEYHTNKCPIENMLMTPYQAAMLIGALSDMSLQTKFLSTNVMTAATILSVQCDQMNTWQLLKSLQALCVIDAQPTKHSLTPDKQKALFAQVLNRVAALDPSQLSMIDRYQLFLCLKYVDNKKIHDTSAVRQHFQSTFISMIGWLRTQQPRPSRTQEKLAEYLTRFRKDIQLEKLINGLFADIYLKDAQVDVEFDGWPHFFATAPDEQFELLRYPRDFYHEVILGCPVVRINYREFDALDHNNPKAIQAFLQKKLAPVGISLAAKATKSATNQQVQPDSSKLEL